jgi:hypothetical protein
MHGRGPRLQPPRVLDRVHVDVVVVPLSGRADRGYTYRDLSTTSIH